MLVLRFARAKDLVGQREVSWWGLFWWSSPRARAGFERSCWVVEGMQRCNIVVVSRDALHVWPQYASVAGSKQINKSICFGR